MNDIERYNSLNKKPPKSTNRVKAYIPTLKEDDYNRGYVRRYFVQKTNDNLSPIYEINPDNVGVYDRNSYYKLVSIIWRIRGPKETEYNNDGTIKNKSVSESNRISISLVDKEMPNLKLYLPNLIQFYKK
jgi:hypothetical protein